jgi:diguanylate cyclase (GGDEF)-like protein
MARKSPGLPAVGSLESVCDSMMADLHHGMACGNLRPLRKGLDSLQDIQEQLVPPDTDSSAMIARSGHAALLDADLATILNRLDALVYVSDMDTHELLFMNAYGRERWGEVEGRRCWQVLQNDQDGPCSFCSNAQLLDSQGKPLGVHVWEFRNTSNGRWYQCRDQAIEWSDGRIVRLEIATDISDRKQMELELENAVARAETLARTDQLSGLNNRRAFFELGERFCRRARTGQPLAVLMFDVDHFKQINDSHGHAAGDALLRALGQLLPPLLRPADVLGRMGGEEFAVLLPDTRAEQALTIAERLRAGIEQLSIDWQGSPLGCTASFGMAVHAHEGICLDTLLNEADQALLKAKRSGRNCICQ